MSEFNKGFRPLDGFKLGSFPLDFRLKQELVEGPKSLGSDLVVVSEGGALLNRMQVRENLQAKLHFPNNFSSGQTPKIIREQQQEVGQFIAGMRRGLLPNNVLSWRDYPKFLSDVVVYRVNGYQRGTELVIVRFHEEGALAVNDPQTQQFVPFSIQYYEYYALHPQRQVTLG